MKALFWSFVMMLRQIRGDGMLAACLTAPLFAAAFFRFGIPYAERLLCRLLETDAVLGPYYLLFDLLLCLLCPYMFCFASAMVMLTEHDEHMTRYMAVTPVGRRGYLVSRLGIPALLSMAVSAVLVPVFSLTAWKPFLLAAACVCSALLGIVVSLFLFVFSRNRVEGMALGKLSGLLLLGLPAPFFVKGPAEYLFSTLPSFWTAKLVLTGNFAYILPAVLLSAAFTAACFGRFRSKLR